jgi:hypothetical protein
LAHFPRGHKHVLGTDLRRTARQCCALLVRADPCNTAGGAACKSAFGVSDNGCDAAAVVRRRLPTLRTYERMAARLRGST